MSSAITSSGVTDDGTRSQTVLDPLTIGAVLVGFALLAIGVHALGSGHPYDFGFYYRGAAAAWDHGDPSVVSGWLGTPFMAAVLAPLTAIFTMGQLAVALSFVNLALLVVGCLFVSRALAPACGRRRGLRSGGVRDRVVRACRVDRLVEAIQSDRRRARLSRGSCDFGAATACRPVCSSASRSR